MPTATADINLKPIPEFLRLLNKETPVISREGLYRKIKSGVLPSYRFGKKILVNPEEIFEAMRQKPTAEEGN